ncbi:cytoskeleton-associated protein 4 [Anguilla rostrata]|uniref:cytoskeleton-associated protein 4 n=1 Tax=Anguilla rostrata TaxID=7938 RepID=UPI0030D6229A
MTAKHRNKNASDKNSTSIQDDVAKKITKASKSTDSTASGSGTWTKALAALSYIALVAAAGFAAFYLQKVVEEVGQISSRTEATIQKNAELTKKMESALQQVDSLKQTVDGFDSTLGRMQTELDSAGWALRKGEAETRRVEEALQKLQNELLQDLSEGIRELKEARDQDSSSLERMVEERLTELTRSIGDSVAEFAGAQSETQTQLRDLKARLDGVESPASLKRELLAVVETVGELQAAGQASEQTAEALRKQIAAVGAELQTRNEEVASTMQEIDSVRELVQSTAGVLRESVSAAEVSVKLLNDQAQSLQSGQDMAAGSIQGLEEGLRGVVAQAEKTGEEVEARLKALEQSADASAAATAAQTERAEALLAKHDAHESALTTLARDVQGVRAAGEAEAARLQAALTEAQQALAGQVEALQGDLGELQSKVAALGGRQTELSSRGSGLGQQLEGLGKRLKALEEETAKAPALDTLKASVSQAQKDVQQLRNTMDSLTAYSKKVEGHEVAITSLKSSLEETKASVSTLSKQKAPGKV